MLNLTSSFGTVWIDGDKQFRLADGDVRGCPGSLAVILDLGDDAKGNHRVLLETANRVLRELRNRLPGDGSRSAPADRLLRSGLDLAGSTIRAVILPCLREMCRIHCDYRLLPVPPGPAAALPRIEPVARRVSING